MNNIANSNNECINDDRFFIAEVEKKIVNENLSHIMIAL
jgi:hypothetical protein